MGFPYIFYLGANLRKVQIPDGRHGTVIHATRKHGIGREVIRVLLDRSEKVLTFFAEDCKELKP
jgi:hypothetical protein